MIYELIINNVRSERTSHVYIVYHPTYIVKLKCEAPPVELQDRIQKMREGTWIVTAGVGGLAGGLAARGAD